MANEGKQVSDDPKARRLTAMIIISFLFALHLLPLLMPESRFWGFNHLLFLPVPIIMIYLAGCVLCLFMFFPPAHKVAGRFYESLADTLFKRGYISRWMILALASLAIFWFGRPEIFLLGDSHSVAANIGNELPVIYKWSEMGVIYLAYFVAKLLPFTGNELGEYAYGLIAVFSGAITVSLFLAIAYELGRSKEERLFIFCLSVFAGWIVLFFGYTENYPVLWPMMTGYIYFSIRYLNHKGNILLPTLLILLSLVLHLQILFFLMSYLLLVLSRGKPAEIYQKYGKYVWSGLALVSIGGGYLFMQLYNNSFEFRTYLMPILEGRPATPDYSIFSLPHLLDVINQMLVLVPLLPALLIMGWRGWRSIVKSKIDLFLILLSLGGFMFLVIIDPKLGMGRDWDLFALSGLAPMLLFSKNIVASRRISKFLYPAVITASLVLVFPFVATNLSHQPAIDNYKSLLRLDLPKSRTGLTILRTIYHAKGDSITVDSIQQALIDAFPAVHQAPRAYQLAEEGRFDEAMILVDSMAMVDPHSVELINLRGTVYLKQGNYARAVRDLELAAKLGRYDSRLLVPLAQAYGHLNQYERMMENFKKAYKRNPKSAPVLEGLATAFFTQNIIDSANYYAGVLMQHYPNHPSAYMVAGFCAVKLGDKASAEVHLTRFLKLAPNDPRVPQVEQLLEAME
jgi:tetratricopeptide (TPR) repeat protein